MNRVSAFSASLPPGFPSLLQLSVFFSCQMPETFNGSRVLKYTYKKWMCWEIRVLALLFNDVSNSSVMREIISHTHTQRQPNVPSFQMKSLTLGQLCTRCESEAASQSSGSFFNAKLKQKRKERNKPS